MPLPEIVTRAAGIAGSGALRRLQHLRLPGIGQASATDDPRTAAGRWRVVTVPTDPDRLRATTPAPLAVLGDRLEVRVTAAPGDRGAELAARFRGPVTEEEIGELRSALRQAKQLAEVGEVLRLDPAPHGHRSATPQGAALEGMTARAAKEGVL